MRIDLGLECTQFSVAGQHMRFHHTLFGFSRFLLRQKNVKQSYRQEIFEDADNQQKLGDVENFVFDPPKLSEMRQRLRKSQRCKNPESADDDRRKQVRSNQAKETRSLNGNAAAGVPS